jgi:predicted Holliday junction resolvase-like endonuclease
MSIQMQIILLLGLLLLFFVWRWIVLTKRFQELNFRKASLSTRYGKMTEQFMPFIKDYPYLPENFRFLGSPIDGVQFEDDRIVFIEFKAASAPLSARQKHIAELIKQRRIGFEEIRIE